MGLISEVNLRAEQIRAPKIKLGFAFRLRFDGGDFGRCEAPHLERIFGSEQKQIDLRINVVKSTCLRHSANHRRPTVDFRPLNREKKIVHASNRSWKKGLGLRFRTLAPHSHFFTLATFLC